MSEACGRLRAAVTCGTVVVSRSASLTRIPPGARLLSKCHRSRARKRTLNSSMTEAFLKAMSGELTPADARTQGSAVYANALGLLILLIEALANPSPIYSRDDLLRGALAIVETIDFAKAISDQEDV